MFYIIYITYNREEIAYMKNSNNQKELLNRTGKIVLQSTILVTSLTYQFTKVMLKAVVTQALFGFAFNSVMSLFA